MHISWMTNLIAIKIEHALWTLHISENFHQICRRNKKTSALAISNEICFPSAFSAYLLVLQTWNRLITLQQASDYAFRYVLNNEKNIKIIYYVPSNEIQISMILGIWFVQCSIQNKMVACYHHLVLIKYSSLNLIFEAMHIILFHLWMD